MAFELDDQTARIAGLIPRTAWDATDLLERAWGSHLGRGLRAIAALRVAIHRQEERIVRVARANGWSWDEIAGSLGMTRQGASKRWRDTI